jgi:hypothetical protein
VAGSAGIALRGRRQVRGDEHVHGRAGAAFTLDAIEFCRIVSGRAPGTSLLAHPLPF